MTTAPLNAPKMPLGVGNIISGSFSILFRNIVAVMLVAFIPALAGLLIDAALNGAGSALGIPSGNAVGAGGVASIVLGTIIQMAIQGLIIALLVQLAYDAKLGRPITPLAYLSPALTAIVPIVVLSLVVAILTGIGFMLLIIPGLYIYAVFCVTTPAIMIERVGFGGMGRSAGLTKDYRWPIVGALILLILCTMALGLVSVFIVGMIVAALGMNGLGIVIGVVFMAAVSGITYGLSGIGAALIYARLRDIKEGVSVDSLAAVFD